MGNNCEVWLANNNTTVQRTQYYPSGLPWAESTGQSVQSKKYNGKEFVEAHGLDEYDSEARWYYPAIMRTTTLDPLAEKYYSISPYAWCGNNPVTMMDPTGMSGLASTYVNSDGVVIAHIDDKDNKVYLVNDELQWRTSNSQGNELNKGLSVVGFENPNVKYNTGDQYIYYPIFTNPSGSWIKPMTDPLKRLEFWLNKDPESLLEAIEQILVDIGYSSINDPYSLFSQGRTLAGFDMTYDERISSFVSVASVLFTDGLLKTGTITKLKNSGLKGYNEFARLLEREIKSGKDWQKNIGRLYQYNRAQLKTKKDVDIYLKRLQYIETIKKHSEK